MSVVLLGPAALEGSIGETLGEGARFESLKYKTNKVQGMADLAEAPPGMRGRLRSQIEQCLRLVYGRGGRASDNLTGILHRQTFRQNLAGRSIAPRLAGIVVLTVARLANLSSFLRRLLQRLYSLLADFTDHRELLDDISPALVVLPSAGLSIDGWFMAEAKRAGIPVVVLSQSWDRTSSKGYPTSSPDYVVVWNEPMKGEVISFWDVAPDRVFVEGAPPWDGHFSSAVLEEKGAFLRARGLSVTSKTIYVALTGPAWHENNKSLVDAMLRLRQEVPALEGVNILIRVHPNYLSKALSTVYRDLKAHLDGLKEEPGLHIDIPDAKSMGNTFIVGDRYESELRAILKHSDVMVSVPSSQLVEAAIFDLPYVELNFGRWKNEVLDVDLGQFILEHFVRLRRHGAGSLCNHTADLGPLILEELFHPEQRRKARSALAKEEAGVYPGHSAQATADRIRKLAYENLPSAAREETLG